MALLKTVLKTEISITFHFPNPFTTCKLSANIHSPTFANTVDRGRIALSHRIKESNMARTSSGVYQLPNGTWGFRYAYWINGKQKDIKRTKDENGKKVVDQDMANMLVDHAIANGVNYFDAAPMYHNGECERVTGTALKRHPRNSYFIATKL